MSGMFSRNVLFVALFVGGGSLHAQEAATPQLDGFVTRVGTPEDFDVNGVHILCRPAGDRHTKDTLELGKTCVSHIYGEHLLIFGRLDKKSNTLHPKDIQSTDHPVGQSVSGFAVLDTVLAPGLLCADGYAIQLMPSTHIKPANAGDVPQAGQWIHYTGKRTGNGAIQANSAEFFSPEVNASEQKLREKNEFDPSAITEDQRQGGVSKAFRGTDYKRVPAAHNDALQQRVDALGERLIPAVQKQLADGDPNKINFRFQVVESLWKDAITLPNGIILVPEPLAELLSDDQLAAVLADNIASALEKQTFRSIPGNRARTAATLTTLLIPSVGLATQVGTGVSAYNDSKHQLEQSGRNALVLMHDAGFDVQQAPIAWWRLSSSKPDFMRDKAPYRAAYLFEVMATDWAPGSPLNRQPAAALTAP